ncbi:asparagine synthase-related protein [Qipengyuania atrilutea]|uniref:asparagine synthase (glutamine-hydrolyzing) n=1 Tax=Qipengyuania atrilutea TaxID=2744473 RepID=A0A850H1J4_9SPHN|nr:asparagine synthase-related protein [Actirhodobacter atriluteus]NVD44556.1 hypothetical protein [Actirhodobacter atriluteus]
MIAASVHVASPPAWFRPDRMTSSLGLFAGASAQSWSHDHIDAAFLPVPRASSGGFARGWSPARHKSGLTTLFDGAIDNRADLAKCIGTGEHLADDALYAAAVATLGADADSFVIGQYTSIVIRPDRSMRLARSPWNGPSLFWMAKDDVRAACNIPRPLFACGFPKRLKPDQLAESLFWIENHEGGYFYEGLQYVPHGAIVDVAPDGSAKTHRWYDPHDVPHTRFAKDSDYVEQANELLADAVRAALAPAKRPGILLSGGLDSAIVADGMLRQLPDDRRLHSFTFVPQHPFADTAAPGLFNDDEPRVRAFASMHRRLDPHFSDNDGIDFDGLADKFMAACDIARPGMAISAAYHGPSLDAAKNGCDWLFHAAMGNNSFSQDGRWAYLEFAKQGRWSELWRMLRDHPGDGRPMWRRLLARSFLPQLPAPVRHYARSVVHGTQEPLNAQASLIRPEAREALGLDRLAERTGDLRRGEWFRSRREWLDFIWRSHDLGAEQHYAAEQVYGLKMRDVTAYRPLIEYCAGLPTDQFVRGGVQRFLARRMAANRMPAEQAASTDYGQHNADWHLRMTRRLPGLRAEFERMRHNDVLKRLIDVEAGLKLLEEWPDRTPADPRVIRRHFHALTGAILMASFYRFTHGSNE